METKQNTACPEVQDNLSAYVDGEVTKSERQLVESHLAECGHCREQLSATMRVIGAVAALPRFEATPAYMARLRERLDQPRSLSEWVANLLDDRRMVTGLAFGMGAAACFAVLSLTRAPVLAPGMTAETSVEVAAGPRKPVETALASTQTAPGSGIAAGVNATGARTPGFGTALNVGSGSANPNLLASVPSVTPVQPAGAPVAPAPIVVAKASPEVVPGVSETELEGMNLQVSGETAPSQVVAAAPAGGFSSGARSARSSIGRVIPSGPAGVARWNPTAPKTTVSTRSDQEEINAAVTPPEPVVRLSELRAALPGQVPLAHADASGASAATQVMVTSAPAFLRELAVLAGQTPGVKLSAVRATLAPGLEVDLELTGDEAAVARLAAQLNASLGHMQSVKAVAAASRPGATSTLSLQIPLAAPIED